MGDVISFTMTGLLIKLWFRFDWFKPNSQNLTTKVTVFFSHTGLVSIIYLCQ